MGARSKTWHPARQERARRIAAILRRTHPDARCALRYHNPLQLLVATILSAQCTDERVNQVTPVLFRKYPTPARLAKAPLPQLETLVHSTGFYRQKAKSLRGIGRALEQRFGGKVPRTMEELITLPGVGRKTAHVILGNIHGVPGIVVDTHVKRLSFRMGLTRHRDPDKIEIDLMKRLPRKDWTFFSHAMIFHGRRICTARKPACPTCPIHSLCPQIGV